MTLYIFLCLICITAGLINLPLVMQGNLLGFVAMGICFACAVACIVLGISANNLRRR